MLYLPLIYLFLLVGPAIAGIAFFRRLSTGGHLFLLGICVLYGISPFLITWAAPSLAKRFGCSAEAIGFRCPSPAWMGDFIYGMTMSHWLAIFVVPSAILGAIGLLLSWILQYQRSRSSGGTSAQHGLTAFLVALLLVTGCVINLGSSGVQGSGIVKTESRSVTEFSSIVYSDGVGSAVLNVSDQLDASVSGVGSVEYIGSPKIQKSGRGLGNIKQRNTEPN